MRTSASPDLTAKKKILFLFWITFALCVGITATGVYLYNALLPMAKPIQVPEQENITSTVLLGFRTEDISVPITQENLEPLLSCLRNAKPTRIQAWNDYPTVWPFWSIEITTEAVPYRYFLYQDDEFVYIEIPYEGIYKADTELLNIVAPYFHED